MKREESSLKSYLMLISAMLLYGTIGVFRRYIPLSSGMLAFSRGLLGSLFLWGLVRLRGRGKTEWIGRKDLLLLALTGALIGANWMLLFEAYNHTTVATATMCYYMQPTLVILLSPLVLRERLTARRLACAGAAVAGMAFVSGVADGGGIGARDLSGVAFGLGAAALYATVILLNKKLQVEDVYKKTAVQLTAATVALAPYVLLTEDFAAIRLDARAAALVLIVGIVHTGVAYAMYFGSMKRLRAQTIALLSYIDPVFALLLSAAVLHEPITPLGLLGAALILGSALVGEGRRQKR